LPFSADEIVTDIAGGRFELLTRFTELYKRGGDAAVGEARRARQLSPTEERQVYRAGGLSRVSKERDTLELDIKEKLAAIDVPVAHSLFTKLVSATLASDGAIRSDVPPEMGLSYTVMHKLAAANVLSAHANKTYTFHSR
jgi:hypothetical protein